MSAALNQQSTTRISERVPILSDKVAGSGEQAMRLGKCWDSSRHLQVDVLAGLFGISAWLSVNAMFTQLPILVQTAPEGWNLPSYLSILIQIANIGPILYSICQKYCPRLISDSRLIYTILFLGLGSLVLMAVYYNHTIVIRGTPHSVVLFILAFCIALVGCTSSVLFIPFMNHYPEVYLVSYMVGEGLSGFIPSIIALVQGVGGNPSCMNITTSTGEIQLIPHTPPPLFSPGTFFSLIFSLMALSTVAFFLLNNLNVCKTQKLRKPSVTKRTLNDSPSLERPMCEDPQPFNQKPNPSTMTPLTYKVLLFLQAIVSMFANGALPSVQSYSCLPYGNLAYHLAVNIGNMANPAACFLTFFIPQADTSVIFSLFLICGVTTSYVLTTAALSPHPPLQGSTFGITLIVITWVISSGLISYVKMSIAALFRREGGRGLFWYGAVTQLGAAIGSIVMFYLINYADLFQSYDVCR